MRKSFANYLHSFEHIPFLKTNALGIYFYYYKLPYLWLLAFFYIKILLLFFLLPLAFFNQFIIIIIKTTKILFQCDFGLVPSTYKFLDALGISTLHPSNYYDMKTWQPKRLVPVNPNAKSNKSSSS